MRGLLTAKEKGLVLKAWRVFLKGGLREADFTNRLYSHLIDHCSFIAHFNRQGFHSVYFAEDPQSTLRFFKQFDPDGLGKSVEYNATYWREGDYADVNEAMREAVRPYLAAIREKAQARLSLTPLEALAYIVRYCEERGLGNTIFQPIHSRAKAALEAEAGKERGA